MTQQQLALGLALRDQGVDDCLAAADSVLRTGYREAAEHALAELAKSEQEFTADDVHRLIPKDLIPHSPNVLPSLFSQWSKKNKQKPRRIRTIGYRQSTRDSRHGGVVRVWVGVQDTTSDLLSAS